ncbi:alpha/beta hydrolase [Longispora albida]|uniref:alpha/beta hydrolase n=1 Tax=Longispora albida TaxID=203523 RepID=UPI00039E3764|nr:alpha/beta hydrolase [Longispora albida]
MVTFAQLREVDPAAFSGTAWRALAGRLASRAEDLAEVPRPLHAWQGKAATAARGHLGGLPRAAESASGPLRKAAELLDAHREQVLKAQALLRDTVAEVRAKAGTVSADGVISGLPEGEADGFAAEFDRALRMARESDTRTAAGLAALMPVAAPVTQKRQAIPGPGTDPVQVRAWWAGLSEEERGRLIREEPGRIGWLDGVPAAARDQANRLTLTEPWAAKFRARPDLLVLGFDPAGDGKVIVATSDPDQAANVLTYVPGTGSELSKMNGDLARAEVMARDANALDNSKRTAAVLWLGYDAPDKLTDAVHGSYASGASGDLARFQQGLRATHEGAPSHNTVLGHSYGSTTVGFAARDRGLPADELVFVGSPGVGVDRASDLRIDPEHVWSTTAKNDPIQYAISPKLDIGDPSPDLVFGQNPSMPDFGGQTFASDPGNPLVRTRPVDLFGVHVDIPVGVDGSAHSQYWDENTQSRKHIAKIVTGYAHG